MGNVSGQIGDQTVILENAATDATLKLILQAILSSGKTTSAETAKMLQKAGLDPAKVKQVETSLSASGKAVYSLGLVFGKIASAGESLKTSLVGTQQSFKTMADGADHASHVFDMFSRMEGPIGAMVVLIGGLVKVQEENFKAYQKLTVAGINFGGTLTDIKVAASSSYMSLNDFTNLMTNNREAFVRFGGNVNDGAVAFSKFSHSVLSGNLGEELFSLGYTAESANQSMITYLAASGISNAKDLETNTQLRQGAAAYLEELDRLATVTGKSREEQEETMKKLQLDAEVQQTAARMEPAARANFLANVKYMTDQYGDAGKDMVVAQAQGRAVITKSAQTLAAVSPGLLGAVDELAKSHVGSKKNIEAQNKAALAIHDGFKNIPLAAIGVNDGLKSIQTAFITDAKNTMAGLTDKEAYAARDKQVALEKIEREKNSSAVLGKTMQSFKELGASLQKAFAPLIEKYITPLIGLLGKFAEFLSAAVTESPKLTAVVIALTAALVSYKAAQGASGVLSKVFGKGGGPAEKIVGSLTGGNESPGGKVLQGVEKGGTATGGALEGLATGLRAFGAGAPQILLGAATLAAAIVAIGAGVAGATWLVGKTLPTFAEGLKAFDKVNGANLKSVGLGVAGLGAGLLLLAPFAVYGWAVAISMNTLADGMVKLSTVDPVKLERVAAAMQKVKDATPSIGQAIGGAISGLTHKLLGSDSSAPSAGATTPVGTTNEGSEMSTLTTEIKKLNTTSMELLKAMKETADGVRKNISATQALNRNLF